MNESIFKQELDKIVEISKSFGIDKIILFGSCLNNVESAHDIDIAVSGIKPRDFFRYYGKVAMEISDEVDIVDMKDLRPYMFNKILTEGKIVYDKQI